MARRRQEMAAPPLPRRLPDPHGGPRLHILSFAAETTANKSRRLIYAATQESYVTAADPLHAPIFLDHFGSWQSLLDPHPTAAFERKPVRLTRPMDSERVVC